MKKNNRGAGLIAVLLAVTVIGSITGLYLRTASSEYKMSARSMMMQSSMNVAEAGAEEAIWAIHKCGDDETEWANQGWTKVDTDIYYMSTQKTIHYKTFNTAILADMSGTVPTIYAGGKTSKGGNESSKQIRIDLATRTPFANGLTAKNGVTLIGNKIEVDSYNSNDGAYDPSNPNDKGSVASVSVAVDSVSINHADIYGYVATGGADPVVGNNGSIKGKDTPNNVKVDQSRISRDFYSEFEDVEIPDSSTWGTSYTGNTIGTAGATTELRLSEIKMTGSSTLNISGDVVLHITDDFTMGGNTEININPDSTLTVYIEGDVDLSGGPVVNQDGLPAGLQIQSNGSSVKLSGHASFYGVIYAPKADFEMKGGGSVGSVYGAVVANTISINGNYAFHYDEALEDLSNDESFRLSYWRELESASEQLPLFNKTQILALYP